MEKNTLNIEELKIDTSDRQALVENPFALPQKNQGGAFVDPKVDRKVTFEPEPEIKETPVDLYMNYLNAGDPNQPSRTSAYINKNAPMHGFGQHTAPTFTNNGNGFYQQTYGAAKQQPALTFGGPTVVKTPRVSFGGTNTNVKPTTTTPYRNDTTTPYDDDFSDDDRSDIEVMIERLDNMDDDMQYLKKMLTKIFDEIHSVNVKINLISGSD